MKRNSTSPIIVCFLFILTAAFSACDSKSDAQPAKTSWIKVYRDVMLGDQENYTIGHFLKTQNGTVVKVEDAQNVQSYLSMMYYTQYAGNYIVLTFPGDGRAASAYADIDENRLFIQNPGGIDHWAQTNLNTGEIERPYRDGADMSFAEFDAIASGKKWSDFNTKFNHYNGDKHDLSSLNFLVPGNGEIYMFQLNNTVRGFIYMKNVVSKSANGGSVKFDMIIEGSDDNAKGEGQYVQPSKD